MTSIVISSGHGLKIRGASGYLDEVDEARKVVDRVAEILEENEVDVTVFHDDVSTSQGENLDRIVDFHNSKTRDLDVSVHFNAYETTSKPMGTECLYVSQQELAADVAAAIADATGLPDRGPKKRTDLYFLNQTEEPAILIETCFVDSLADEQAYLENFEDLCEAIAGTIAGIDVSPVPPEPGEPTEPEPDPNKGRWHEDITATVFGMGGDEQESAYGGWIDESTVGVSFPYKWREIPRPTSIEIENMTTGEGVEVDLICDVGPWNIEDPEYVFGFKRPLVEKQFREGLKAQNDRVPTNDAAIDLTVKVAEQIGISGKGKVRWRFK